MRLLEVSAWLIRLVIHLLTLSHEEETKQTMFFEDALKHVGERFNENCGFSKNALK